MKVRFQADADLNQIILRALIRHEPEIDFQTATRAALTGLTDQDVLASAAREGRVLVSHDQTTMPYHFADFIASKTSSGLIVIPQRLPLSSAVEDLFLIRSASEADEWINRICFLPL